MQSFLWLINSLGLIFGPAMLAAWLFALAVCLRATFSCGPLRTGKLAFIASFLPLVLGISAAVVAFILVLTMPKMGGFTNEAWVNLGKCVLAGFVFTLLPLFWSLLLRIRKPVVI